MSFDILIQAFSNGGAGSADETQVRRAMTPYLDETGPYPRLRAANAEAELYASDPITSFMVNRVTGPAIYDVLVDIAKACDLVILPVGSSAAIVREDQRVHLPEALRASAVVVTSGAELIALITS